VKTFAGTGADSGTPMTREAPVLGHTLTPGSLGMRIGV
jgi:hypothetical protein